MRVQLKVQAAQRQSVAWLDAQILLAHAVADDARRPTLLKEQLMFVVALKHDAHHFQGGIGSGDAQVKGDFLHGVERREGQFSIFCGNDGCRSAFQSHEKLLSF